MKNTERFVLLVEDDPDDQLLFEEGLSICCNGVTLKVLGDGLELMDYLQAAGEDFGAESFRRPGIIFLDLNMPRKGGLSVLKYLKNTGFKDIAVVIWTTAQDDDTINKCYQSGADLFFTKPEDFDQIVASIEMAVNKYLPAA